MKSFDSTARLRRIAAALGALALLVAARPARAQSPDFDAVAWLPIGCPAADLTHDTSPGSVNFVGDATFPAAYYAYDSNYLYFRYRMDKDPANAGGFDQYSWTALMQTPTGNPFQYQYQLVLDGNDDAIEIWANTNAEDIDFSPLFHDDAEVQLFSQPYTTGSLARSLATIDGSNFGNNPDFFLDFAFPVTALVAHGVVADAAELADAHFFPATSTAASVFNKGYLNCSFLPTTDLAIDKAAEPAVLPANTTAPLTYTIAVANVGLGSATGVIIEDIALPAYMTGAMATVSSLDPSITWEVVSTNPLQVRVPRLPAGAMVVVELSVDATPTCADGDFMNVATTFATNAMDAQAVAMVGVPAGEGVELCDGADNDCDGQADEGADATCDDGDACTGSETCGGAAGCQPGTPPTCDDGNACTVDACDPALGCTNGALPGCMPCNAPADCNDGNPCTAESCTAGVCDPSTPIPGCEPCAMPGDCSDDGNACTDATCDGGVCGTSTIPGCVPCATDGDCDDQNACTTDTCPAGACVNTATPGCVPCATAGDCGDGNGCTTDVCSDGTCANDAVAGCVPCTTAADCGDGNGCTDDVCSVDGVCSNPARPGCIPCATDADCGDGNGCTVDQCGGDGSCEFSTIPGCVPCTVPTDCEDGDVCTTETCTGGVCGHQPLPNCPLPIEECDDGIDNDDDTAVDCGDTDCADDPVCRAEVCGDCMDNDGDGLVDYEDPDCCAEPAQLALRRVMLKPSAKVKRTRLNVRVKSAAFDPTGLNPTTQDTTLQLSDGNGQIFCQTVAAPNWKARKRTFRFRDKKGTFAGGLKNGKFKMKKNGQIVFRTRGKKVVLRPTDGGPVRVTLAVGSQCAQSTASLRAKRKALVFP